jgi:predicted O-linked N-acetylglucosamine transferase (SPINDLY family)
VSDTLTLNPQAVALIEQGRATEALALLNASGAADAGVFYLMGLAHHLSGERAQALSQYDKAVALRPELAEAHYYRGLCLEEMKRYGEALMSLGRAAALNPDADMVLAHQLLCAQKICRWDEAEAITARIASRLEAATPLSLLATPLDAAAQRRCAELYARKLCPIVAAPPAQKDKDKIRIGYFSADFYDHPVANLFAGIPEHHDKDKFEVFGFAYGPGPDDHMRKRISAACTRFMDLRGRPDAEVSAAARGAGIDIAVDLTGVTSVVSLGIFAARPAPVSVQWLGTPGTLGAAFIDYIIADPVLIPPAHRVHYAEKVITLPDTYQPNDSDRALSIKSFTRAQAGLPDKGFVFCGFNNSVKISRPLFDVWMRLLAAVPESVLWLFDDGAESTANLRAAATERGVAPHRLIFAPRLMTADHIERHKRADLFLDSFFYGAHTTASDALWAGVPVVTYLGETFASRVAAGLLTAAGLPELITRSHEHYEATALDLARNPSKLAALKTRLAEGRDTCALFDTARFTRHLEAAYTEIWRRHRAELPPDHIVIHTAAV